MRHNIYSACKIAGPYNHPDDYFKKAATFLNGLVRGILSANEKIQYNVTFQTLSQPESSTRPTRQYNIACLEKESTYKDNSHIHQ